MTEVELDVFSGRPNPVWRLDAAAETRLNDLIAAAAPVASGRISDGLGYRGFVVRYPDRTVRVQRGTIVIERGADRQYRADPDRAVERWLLVTGHAALDAGIREFAAAELEK